ncbi:condensation domain-containing protein, partial [Actinoplanes sp. KI2]|uniref:condensation domain-containing protein n=1 Tax=Actinoplanes sp. KI2 TaxID=2983315 RepID=UPI0021D5B949
MRGAFDPEVFEQAWGDVVERHEALRTRFPDELGVAYQHVEAIEDSRTPLSVERVSVDELSQVLQAAVLYPFDLGSELPVRVSVFELGGGEFVVLVLMHHIVSDGWSLA